MFWIDINDDFAELLLNSWIKQQEGKEKLLLSTVSQYLMHF